MPDHVKAAMQKMRKSFKTGQNHAFGINFCVKFVISFEYRTIQRMKIKLFYKNYSVSFM